MGAQFRVIAAIAVMVVSTSAMAESTFLLQLGSFTTDTEAQDYWQRVSADNAELLQGYRYQPTQVSVPPDDYVVHRVQVGPVADQQAAQELCDALNTRQISCYIVETAMFTPSDNAQPAMASSAAQPEMASEMALAPDAEIQTPAAIVTPPQPSAPLPDPVLEQASSEPMPEMVALPAPQPMSLAAPAPAPQPAPAAETIPLPWLNAEADTAPEAPTVELAAQPETAINPARLPAQSVAELNAFSDRGQAPVLAEEQATVVVAASPPPVLAAPLRSPAPVIINRSDAQTPPEQNIVIAERAPRPLMVPGRAPLAPMPPVQDSSRLTLAPANVPVPAPVMVQPVAPLQGEVTVAEAIPVPLSEMPQAEYVPTPNPVYRPRALGWGGLPSQNHRQQALWAELDYFPTERDAVNYWNRLRSQQPQITQGMRMRVTKPYFQQGGNQRVSLRMGPFVSMMDVREVCDMTQREGLRCDVVRDLGATTAANQPRYRPFAAPSDPYHQRASLGRPMHWVVLGSFTSPADANANWQAASMRHGDLLGRMQPNIERPAFSSAQQSIFRLRTGPFASQLNAQDLCNGLRMRGVGCVVVVAR